MKKKCIILKREQQILTLFFQDNRLVKVGAEEPKGSLLGKIYIARVKDVVPNIHAAFVEIQPGLRCFFSLKEEGSPILLNRTYNGKLKAEDELLVQITKEAIGSKPPTVSSRLSLDGKYCVVFMDGSVSRNDFVNQNSSVDKAAHKDSTPKIFYSGKLSAKSRKRIANELDKYSWKERQKYGIIVRTNAGSLMENLTPLTEEIELLHQKMEELLALASCRTCFSLLYEKPPTYLVMLRDMGVDEYQEIVTDEKEIFTEISAFSQFSPKLSLPPLRFYQDKLLPLHRLYSVEERLQEALSPKVWLKSGGYLMIEPTEALTVIDVNSGKIDLKKNPEEVYIKINMEAAKEVAHQLILRNLSGIIIVDFINMSSHQQEQQLLTYLGDLLKKDSVKTNLIGMTRLGLVEITRRKISKPLREQMLNFTLSYNKRKDFIYETS